MSTGMKTRFSTREFELLTFAVVFDSERGLAQHVSLRGQYYVLPTLLPYPPLLFSAEGANIASAW